ncbi:MAG: nucleotidyltransferase family protein [Bacteroidota bacterium]
MTAILLAAGTSSRMGSINKMGLPFRGKPILLWAVDQLLIAAVDEIIVVIGHEVNWAKELLQGKAVQVVVNDHYLSGQLTSIQAGLQAMSDTKSDFLIGLADMPLLLTEHYNALLVHHQQQHSPTISFPYNGEVAGHPKVFSASFRKMIIDLQSDPQKGAKPIILQHPSAVQHFITSDEAYFFDVDTPEAYAKLITR